MKTLLRSAVSEAPRPQTLNCSWILLRTHYMYAIVRGFRKKNPSSINFVTEIINQKWQWQKNQTIQLRGITRQAICLCVSFVYFYSLRSKIINCINKVVDRLQIRNQVKKFSENRN